MSKKITDRLVDEYFAAQDQDEKDQILSRLFNGKTFYDSTMKHNGVECILNVTKALEGEKNHGLPPYGERRAFLVDEYPACPDNWIRSSGRTKSFFVPVQEGKGMWLDFNGNWNNKYEVAVVISVQGINPITGLPCTDMKMEQYLDKCPKHHTEFGPDRNCKKCGFNWPKQNYITTTTTPNGYLWLDGFRSIEGVVRQYILTQEKMKGVAAHVIGKDRVYAIGLAFYLSKDKKPVTENNGLIRSVYFSSPVHTPVDWGVKGKYGGGASTGGSYGLLGTNMNVNSDGHSSTCSTSSSSSSSSGPSASSKTEKFQEISVPDLIMGDWSAEAMSYEPTKQVGRTKARKGTASKRRTSSGSGQQVNSVVLAKKLEVGAGSKIDQQVYDDDQTLDFWREEHEAMICVNYCSEEDAIKILEAGRQEIEVKEEGFLQEIPVGN